MLEAAKEVCAVRQKNQLDKEKPRFFRSRVVPKYPTSDGSFSEGVLWLCLWKLPSNFHPKFAVRDFLLPSVNTLRKTPLRSGVFWNKCKCKNRKTAILPSGAWPSRWSQCIGVGFQKTEAGQRNSCACAESIKKSRSFGARAKFAVFWSSVNGEQKIAVFKIAILTSVNTAGEV